MFALVHSALLLKALKKTYLKSDDVNNIIITKIKLQRLIIKIYSYIKKIIC